MKKKNLWLFYQDVRREWRWRNKARNGKIIGQSSEGYKRLAACKKNARRNGWDETEPTEIFATMPAKQIKP